MSDQRQYRERDTKTTTGIFFLIIGIIILAYKLDVPFIPSWLFTWPSILLMIGLYIGVKHHFRNPGWILMIAIGGIFLLDQQIPNLRLHDYTFPIVFIAIGVFFILRPRRYKREKIKDEQQLREEIGTSTMNFNESKLPGASANHGEYIEMNSVFGGAKKIILSKNFKGGEINCFMGGGEVDLTQADLQGSVILEINAVFGGAKLILPPHWDLKTELTTVFGGIEDKRPVQAAKVDTSKVLILKGAVVFGGIDIRSY